MEEIKINVYFYSKIISNGFFLLKYFAVRCVILNSQFITWHFKKMLKTLIPLVQNMSSFFFIWHYYIELK